jgi:hypothetical protein
MRVAITTVAPIIRIAVARRARRGQLGGAGGAVLGNVLGGGVLGTVAGGVGGALLGRHLDKKHDAAQNRRNGC